MKKPSKHLIARYRFNHVRTSIAHETAPKVIQLCFPGVDIRFHKADNYWTVPTADGGTSEVWLGGTDDKERMEKLLGVEYSTIYLNEASQIPWDSVPLLITRLAENSGLALKFFVDLNPPGKKHWTYRFFHDGTFPDKDPHGYDVGWFRLNPHDNLANLPPEYLRALAKLPKRQRQRFLDGLYLADIEGALWTDLDIVNARLKTYGEFVKTIIVLDPSTKNNPGSDECGIGVASLDEFGTPVIRKDLSRKCSTKTWAQIAVNAYHAYNANYIVAEQNQGGDLVTDAIKSIDEYVPVELVHASQGKFARAEPAQELYELNEVAHAEEFPELEAELTETVFDELKSSPNRLDWLVYAIHDLKLKDQTIPIHIG